MADKIRALDGAVIRINGVAYPIPKGTEITIRKGNAKNIIATGTEINGDGSITTLYSVTSGMMEGIVVRLDNSDLEDSFNDLFSDDGHKFVLENGELYYSGTGSIISPSEDGTPAISSTKRTTEAFSIRVSGKIQRQ